MPMHLRSNWHCLASEILLLLFAAGPLGFCTKYPARTSRRTNLRNGSNGGLRTKPLLLHDVLAVEVSYCRLTCFAMAAFHTQRFHSTSYLAPQFGVGQAEIAEARGHTHREKHTSPPSFGLRVERLDNLKLSGATNRKLTENLSPR